MCIVAALAFLLASVPLEKTDSKQNVRCRGPSTDTLASFFLSVLHVNVSTELFCLFD